MKKITPCLWFTDDVLKAFRFYKSIFKKHAKLTEIYKRDGKALYGSFQLFGQDIMFIARRPAKIKSTMAFSFFLSCADQKEVDYYWSRLSKGGEPVQCGWLTDKYGIAWQIIPVQLGKLMNVKDKKQSERVFQAMVQMVKLDVEKLKRAAKGTK